MYVIVPSKRFRRQVKQLRKADSKLLDQLNGAIETLRLGKTLPRQNNDHSLMGSMRKFRECHIAPDWLLIYRKDEKVLLLELTATGTHTKLFD